MVTSFEASLPAGQAAPVATIAEDWAAERPAPPPLPRPAPEKPAPPAIELTDGRVREAVAATIAEAPDKPNVAANQQPGLRAPTLSAEQTKNFEKNFAFAKVPYCLGQDSLKFQPPKIGPIVFGGLLGLPFLLMAAARGKCR